MKTKYLAVVAVAGVLAAGVGLLRGADSHETTGAPGFRPESKQAEKFLKEVGSSHLAIWPSVTRTMQGTTWSEASQTLAVDFAKEKKWGVPVKQALEPDLGQPEGKFQFDIFKSDMAKIGKVVREQKGADYYLVLEQLVTPTRSGGMAVGGIHIYILDAQGENAFSFLLNSHHRILTDAKLHTSATGDAGRDELVMKGTKVALEALEAQMKEASH